MGASFYGELVVRITSDTKGLSRGLAEGKAATAASSKSMTTAATQARVNWERAGLAMQNVGRTMTQFVSLPAAVAFGAAGVSAYKYEKSLQKLQTMVSMTAEEARTAGDAFLRMGDQFGRGAQELSESYYFISSSGYKGAEAMSILEASAKAAAAGMGDVQSIADLVTSAMSAYGKEQYSATDALDIFLKTIEVGKAEPEHLAGTLGRIMSIAQQINVPLEEVGGTIAAMTLTGKSTAEAVTALRGTLMALSAPAKMSIDALKKVDLTYKDVTRSLSEKGLIPTLQMLFDKFDGNRLKMRQVIPNIRALAGVYDLLGENMEESIEVTKQVSDAQGQLEKSFSTAQESIVFKLEAAWARIKNAFIEIGQVVLPYIADFAEWLADVLQKFQDLDEGTKRWIVRLGLVAVAIGPVTMALGSVIRSLAIMHKAFAGVQALGGLSALMGSGAAAASAGAAPALATSGVATAFAGLATMIPQAAIAAALATAIVWGADKAAKKIASEIESHGGSWALVKDAWDGFWDWATDDTLAEGGMSAFDSIAERLPEILSADLAERNREAWRQAAIEGIDTYAVFTSEHAQLRIPYLMEDINKLFTDHVDLVDRARFEVETHEDMTAFRDVVMEELDITKREANALMTVLFPDMAPAAEKAGEVWTTPLERLQATQANLREQMARAVAFGTSQDRQRISTKLQAIGEEIDALRNKAKKKAGEIGAFPNWVATGLNKNGNVVKDSADFLRRQLMKPFGGVPDAMRGTGHRGANALAYGAKMGASGAWDSGVLLKEKLLEPMRSAQAEARESGSNAGWAFANSAALAESGAYNSGVLLAEKLLLGLRTAGGEGSPWKTTWQSGEWAVEGFVLGIADNSDRAVMAMDELARGAMAVVNPSYEMGLSIADGVARGIKDGSTAAVTAAKMMGREILGVEAESLGLSYSPQAPESLRLGPVYRPGGGVTRVIPVPTTPSRTPEPAPAQIIEENFNVNLPAGTTLVGSAQTVAGMLAPHLSHQVRMKELERMRRH